MTSVNIKYPEERAVEVLNDNKIVKQTLSEFTHQAVQERINRLNGGVPDGS